MSYSRSVVDNRNFRWFKNDRTRSTLVGISIEDGNIRGIYPTEISFEYPISAFVGQNGSGKSTLLHLLACAFHNNQDGYRQFGKKRSPYYTFGDFFTFSSNEVGIGGIKIKYKIRKSPDDIWETRKKKPSGKWNDYNKRSYRNVLYFGINRIVPPTESSVHRVYRKAFVEQPENENFQRICEIAGRILSRHYSKLALSTYRNYRLFTVFRNGYLYSGFNMGAGEHAVFSVLVDLFSAGKGSLLVIDEIELGLHVKAQKAFIDELKNLCDELKCQILCSTHSDVILDAIPPEARFFIDAKKDETEVTPKVSSKYAFGKLLGGNSNELDIFVEDDVAEALLEVYLPLEKRERVRIHIIGSDQAVIRQVAAHYREKKYNFIAVLDGDKRMIKEQHISDIGNYLETKYDHAKVDFVKLISERIDYLPGDKWPEIEIIERLLKISDTTYLQEIWNADRDSVQNSLEQALTAGKHKEFHSLSISLHKKEDIIREGCLQFLKRCHPDALNECSSNIAKIIDQLI